MKFWMKSGLITDCADLASNELCEGASVAATGKKLRYRHFLSDRGDVQPNRNAFQSIGSEGQTRAASRRDPGVETSNV